MAMGLWPWRKPQIWRNQQKPTSKTTQSPQLTCKIHICKGKKNQICKKPPNNLANPMPQLSSLNHHTPQHHQNQCRHETPPKNLDLKFLKKKKKKKKSWEEEAFNSWDLWVAKQHNRRDQWRLQNHDHRFERQDRENRGEREREREREMNKKKK